MALIANPLRPVQSPPADRRIVSAEDDAVFEDALDLVAKVFGGPKEYHRLKRGLDPTFRRSDTLVATVDGRPVSHVQLVPREMRVGRAAVPLAVLACLATEENERRKRHGAALIDAAVEAMQARGHTLAMLFTDLPGMFRAFGWVAFPIETYTARLGGEPASAAIEGVRKVDPLRDLESIAAVHGHYGSSYAGPLIRTLGWWRGNLGWMPEQRDSFVVYEQDGMISGYARARFPTAVHGDGAGPYYSISDLAAVDGEGEALLLAWLVGDARRRGFAELGGQAPLAGRAVAMLAELGVEASVRIDERMMLRLLDFKGLLDAVMPEFNRLLRRAAVPDGRTTLRVRGQSASLVTRNGTLEIEPGETGSGIQLSEEGLWRLVLQGRQPAAMQEPHRTLLRRLFPEREFAFWRADTF